MVLLLLFLHNHPLPIKGALVAFLNSQANFVPWPNGLDTRALISVVEDKQFVSFMHAQLFSPSVSQASPAGEASIQTKEERFEYTVKLLRHAVGLTEKATGLLPKRSLTTIPLGTRFY